MPSSVVTAEAPATESVALPSADQALVLLETMKTLLDRAARALGGGEALPLLEVSRQINQTAGDLMAVSLRMGALPWTEEAQQHRRKLLAELGQQRAFCRAMLRRWRRSLALRRQLLALRGEPLPYTEAWQRNGS